MSEHKRRSAEQLFDAFGTLDDKYIAEAQSVKTRHSYRRAFLPAAALLLLFVILLAIPSSRTKEQSSDDGDREYTENVDQLPEASDPGYGPVEIYTALELCKDVQAQPLTEMLDGKAKLIWQYGKDTPRYVELTERDFNPLISSLSDNAGDTEGGRADIKIWICYADGRVVTPLLKPSAGNIGYGTLFDYTDEVIPSQNTVDLVYSIITQST